MYFETKTFSIHHQTSEGGAECFPELKVGVYKEIVPMGVDPDIISYRLAGKEESSFNFDLTHGDLHKFSPPLELLHVFVVLQLGIDFNLIGI